MLGAKTESKSVPKRGQNLRAKKLRLGNDLCRFWIDLGRGLGGIFVDFLLVFCSISEKSTFSKLITIQERSGRPKCGKMTST